MDTEQAMGEATRRWGQWAGICCGHLAEERCQVGASINGFFTVLGVGATWEAAFADADRRGQSADVIPIHRTPQRAAG